MKMNPVGFMLLGLTLTGAMADKPAVPPAYQAPKAAAPAADSYGSPAADTYGSPAADSYGSPAAQPAAVAQDSYGSPLAPPETDSYGSPAAPVVDEYGSPAAPASNSYAAPAQQGGAAEAAPGGNQGYYYYYYPVKQNAPAAQQQDDGGLLGSLGSLLGPLLGKKVLILALIISGVLVLAALGVNLGRKRSFGGPSFSDMAEEVWYMADPYMTQENLMFLANTVQRAISENY